MKQKIKRILNVALVLCLAANVFVFCNIPETAQAAAYKKTITKTVKLKGAEAKELKFKTKNNASLTLTAKVKNASDSEQYRYVTMFCEGTGHTAYFINPKKLSNTKIECTKGTQNLIITSAGVGTVTLTIEIKSKKSALKFVSLKKTHVRKGASSDDEK